MKDLGDVEGMHILHARCTLCEVGRSSGIGRKRAASKAEGGSHMEGFLAIAVSHCRVELPLGLCGVLPLIGLAAGDLADEILAQDGPALGL